MSHVLVKWTSQEAWDVYPVTCLMDKKVAATTAKKPSLVGSFTGEVFHIKWDSSKEPAPAYLVAAGEHKKMKKLRTEMAEQALAGGHEPVTASSSEQHSSEHSERCCTHKSEVKRLRKEVKDLEERLCESENRHEAAKMVRRLGKIMSKVQCNQPQAVEQIQEDIGNGILLNTATLDRLHNTFQGKPSRFERNLLRLLFTTEELRDHSLYGIQSNVQKRGTGSDKAGRCSRLYLKQVWDLVDPSEKKLSSNASHSKKNVKTSSGAIFIFVEAGRFKRQF
ncbi:uncharacterized protein LOC135387092 [Ornithodoros turicata]|uniref:uncharacterized protein LOC135387092 n=1 Tax=Ornithodoros turicata TaxID=34597 RepID=UPI003139F792